MAKIFDLEKEVWTESDFDDMSWHDNTIHGISFGQDSELLLDIDYIFEWVHPKKTERHFKFWIAPCTMVFENTFELKIDMDISLNHHRKIDVITREESQRPKNAAYTNGEIEYDWIIETLQGEINFRSIGYKLYVRQQPILINNDELTTEARGETCFSKLFSR